MTPSAFRKETEVVQTETLPYRPTDRHAKAIQAAG